MIGLDEQLLRIAHKGRQAETAGEREKVQDTTVSAIISKPGAHSRVKV